MTSTVTDVPPEQSGLVVTTGGLTRVRIAATPAGGNGRPVYG